MEGYTESAAIGLLAGLNAAYIIEGKKLNLPPTQTAIGALLHYITSPESAHGFQPMNINWGLLDTLMVKKLKKETKIFFMQTGRFNF